MSDASQGLWESCNPRSWWHRLSALRPDRAVTLLLGVVGGLVGFALLVAAVLPLVFDEVIASVQVELVLPEETELEPLRERSYVYAADGTVLATLHDEIDRDTRTLDEVPEHVWQAVVTAEDRRFFEHEGYDVEGMARAVVANVQARGIAQGGSTITQQLAKLNFLDDSTTLHRKFAEVQLAVALEQELTKETILERYLNEVYFGSGAYGIQAAAEEFFDRDAPDLEPQHAALLAGLIRSPGSFDPREDPETARLRRNRILTGMVEEGYLDERHAMELVNSDVDLAERSEPEVLEPYIVEAVKREFLQDPRFGDSYEERYARLFGGGIELHTTIDLDLQEAARDVVEAHFPDEAPTAAIASVEPGTGAIVALHGGQDFKDEQFDLALQGRKQPGSVFKAFVMLEALRQGFPTDLALDGGSPLSIHFGEPRDDWEVSNYGGASYGTIDLAEATRRSINTYYAQLTLLVGVDEIVRLTEELGINPAAYGRGAYEAIGIGGLDRGVTPLEVASAFSALGNQGSRTEPHLLARVVKDGQDVWTHEADTQEVLDPAVNAVAVDLLREAVEDGTGTAAMLDGWEVAGKTGTTSGNYAAWFAGVTPALSTAVWVGHPVTDVEMAEATGGSLAAPVWRDFMTRALEGYEPAKFPEADPDALVELFDGVETQVPDLTRLEETEALFALAEARLIGDVTSVDSGIRQGEVVFQRPSAGSTVPLGSRVLIGISTGQPPPEEEDDDEVGAGMLVGPRGFEPLTSAV